jgi:hypothetical protein
LRELKRLVPKIRLRDMASSTRDLGCGLLTILFISLPVWVLSLGWRGPLFAIGSLIVLFALVFGIALLNRFLERH